eukprot:TRINITY_DN9903_c0_g1_i1.p1 TRINITY_DN9903_c0_g1~~TRINITY_DN9903_c0_g1_i1.p1  ORF type:complete len:165 (-),score=50.20 TRINITY_DN9903_c0_g1_i1:96-590(-)
MSIDDSNDGGGGMEYERAMLAAKEKSNIAEEIEYLLETLRQLGMTVEEFEEGQQHTIFEKLEQVSGHYQKLSELQHTCDVVVPKDVLNFIDEGRNPDRYTRQVLKNCLKISKQTEAKLSSLNTFNDIMAEELSKAYPAEMDAYKGMQDSWQEEEESQERGPGSQ